MLYLEESLDSILSEEGQTLMGLPFLVSTLNLSMKRIELLFKKSAMEYSMRRPIKETRTFSGNPIIMPEGTLSVRAVRYGVLEDVPKFYMPTFGEMSYEFERHTRVLKVWPPIYPIKVTYNRMLKLTRDIDVEVKEKVEEGETSVFTYVPCAPKDCSIVISKNGKTMTQKDRFEEKIQGYIGAEIQDVIELDGDLGTGTLNVTTKELELALDDESEGEITCIYKPEYLAIQEIGLEDYVFNKLFASKLLEALASLRAQATQDVLHNIDLTTDDLYARVRELKRELRTLLRNTISFSSMAQT